MFEWLGFGRNDEPPRSRDRIEPTFGNMSEAVDVDSSDIDGMRRLFGTVPTSAGAIVNPRTANRVAAVYACRRLVAGAIATLPLPIYKRTTDGGRELTEHDLWWLLNEQPTPRFTAASFWEFVTSDMLMRGDGIAYIVRGPRGVGINGIVPVRRDNVLILRMGDRLRYSISDFVNGEWGYFTVDQDDVLHFPGDTFDGCQSLSVIQSAARQAIGIALKSDEFVGSFFGAGAQIQYAVKSPKKMVKEQQDEFREAWLEKYGHGQGGISKVPLILTEGLEVQELSMTAADAQLLESRRFQVVDIARAFGVPPHMIGETSANSSWGTGVEQMSIGFVKYALMPHLVRFKQELNRKLFRIDRFFTEFDVDEQLAGDAKTQADALAKALGGPGSQGYLSVNEARRRKKLPPKPGWDDIKEAGSAPAGNPQQGNDNVPDPEAAPAGS